MSAQELWARERYPHLFKPKGCPLRKTQPIGPMKGCEEACRHFEACVEITRKELIYDEWLREELERLDERVRARSKFSSSLMEDDENV